jgi:hypothetical protein
MAVKRLTQKMSTRNNIDFLSVYILDGAGMSG